MSGSAVRAAVAAAWEACRTATASPTRWAGVDTTNSPDCSTVEVAGAWAAAVEAVPEADDAGPDTRPTGSDGAGAPGADDGADGDDAVCAPPAACAVVTGCDGEPDAPDAAGAEAGAGAGAAGWSGEAAAADGTCGVAGTGDGAGAAGAVGRGVVARGGRRPSGSTYPASWDATRTPRWTLATECSGSPLEPIVATDAPSSTASPFATSTVPRWTSVTAYPSAVRIVRLRPYVGSEPAKLTVPDAGARIDDPAGPATSMPRCCPAAYASPPSANGRRTSPSAGQDHAAAGPDRTSAAALVAPIRRRRCTKHLLRSLRGQRGNGRVARPPDGVNRAPPASGGTARCAAARGAVRRHQRRGAGRRRPPRARARPRRHRRAGDAARRRPARRRA